MASVDDGHHGVHSSEEDLTGNMSGLEDEEEASVENSITEKVNLIKTVSEFPPKSRKFNNFGRALTKLEMTKRGQVFGGLENEKDGVELNNESFQIDSPTTIGQKTSQAFALELDHTDEKHDDRYVGTIPKVSTFKRMSSHTQNKVI